MLEVRERKTSQEGVNGNNSLPQMFICFHAIENRTIFSTLYEIDLLYIYQQETFECHSAALEQT